MEELQQTNSQLQDQNTLLKAQLSAGAVTITSDNPPETHVETVENAALQQKLKQLEEENMEKDSELERLRKDQDDLLELLTDQDCRLNTFKNRLRELGENIEDDEDSDNNSAGEPDVK